MLLMAVGCAPPPPPPPPDDFVVCWEVLLPTENEGNLAAQIIGTPPDDTYGLAAADVPSAGMLELFGTHDSMGHISSLEGFAYTDPDGWRTRVAFVDSLTPGAPQTTDTSRTIRAELPGMFLWITWDADSRLQIAYAEDEESTGSTRMNIDTTQVCLEFSGVLSTGPASDSLASHACFVHEMMSCLSLIAEATNLPGWETYGSKRNAAGVVTRFADLACQQIARVPVQSGAAPNVYENVAGWMTMTDLSNDERVQNEGRISDAE